MQRHLHAQADMSDVVLGCDGMHKLLKLPEESFALWRCLHVLNEGRVLGHCLDKLLTPRLLVPAAVISEQHAEGP
jgi:hypothetical protein